ncbi:MAG: alpha/beta hydrolase [Bdellovibrionaceae bacterium]|nr:alpha/beta hydrolase [Pseudobdellovibrionaceae bacterium]
MAVTSHAKISKIQFPTEDGLKLNARIYEQQGAQLAPAILLVEGSGKSHFEEELESSPFFQLAEDLSKHGFVAMTFSKRGSASNAKNGSWAKSSFWSDNKDAQSALNFLRKYKGVDSEKIYLFGQSIGCLHSTLLAQKNKVKGVVLFAGGYQNFYQILEEQNLVILGLMGKSQADAKKEIEPMMRALTDLKNGKFNCKSHQALCATEDGETIVDGTQQKYLVDLFKLEPLSELSKVSAPVLILQGTSDFVIAPSEFDRAKKLLSDKHNFSFQLLDKIDHIMSEQKDQKASLQAMMEIKKTKVFAPLAPKLSTSITSWLKREN